MFKLKSKMIIMFIIISMLLSTCPGVAAVAADVQSLSYLALGDSIAKGYSCDETVITAYPELVSRQLELDTGSTVELDNLAKNGLSTVRFNASMLEFWNISDAMEMLNTEMKSHPTQEGQQPIAEAEDAPKSSVVSVGNLIAMAGTGVTGVLLIVLGLWKGKRREEKDEDITGGN